MGGSAYTNIGRTETSSKPEKIKSEVFTIHERGSKYVVFQDVISVYDTETGELVATFNLCRASPKGVGQSIF